jgi:hypothetical protein
MITIFILTIFSAIAVGFLVVLPEAEPLPSGVSDAFASFVGFLEPFDVILNVSLFLTLFGLVIAFEVSILTIYAALFFLRKIPGVS